VISYKADQRIYRVAQQYSHADFRALLDAANFVSLDLHVGRGDSPVSKCHRRNKTTQDDVLPETLPCLGQKVVPTRLQLQRLTSRTCAGDFGIEPCRRSYCLVPLHLSCFGLFGNSNEF